MNKIKLSLLLCLFTAVLFSCKKDHDKGTSIDYSAITEQRILEVSEQQTIKDDDISDIELLLSKVIVDSTKQRLSEMFDGVKIIKDFLPQFEVLKTDPDINFQELYTQLEAALSKITDALPRKAKLTLEMSTLYANYSTEEYTYPEYLFTPSASAYKGKGLGDFLANNYDIHPVEGKPFSYLRMDIEGVDSLNLPGTYQETSISYSSLKTFKGLHKLILPDFKDDTLDLNYLKELEYLELNNVTNFTPNTDVFIDIDDCRQLKHLVLGPVGGISFLNDDGATLDFTNKYPLLETLILPANICQNLVTVLLPDKQHLEMVEFPGVYPQASLPKVKRLVIEGNRLGRNGFSVSVGSPANLEIDEIKITGLGLTEQEVQEGADADINFLNYLTLSISGVGGETEDWTPIPVKVKKFTLSAIDGSAGFNQVLFGRLELEKFPDLNGIVGATSTRLAINNCHFQSKPDFTNLNPEQLEEIEFTNNQFDSPIGFADFSGLIDKISAASFNQLMLKGLSSYPDKTLDLSRFENMVFTWVTTATKTDGQILNKVILNKAVEDSHYFAHGNEEGIEDPIIEFEFK